MAVGNVHPGKITYIDGDTNEVVAERNAVDVPESGRFADTPEGRVAVVRVESRTAGAERFVREYGPDGSLLRATVMLATPQSAKKK